MESREADQNETEPQSLMQKLRGTGSTFSTSGKAWRPYPFGFNPKVLSRQARLHRLVRNGTIKPMTKAEARAANEQAAAQWLKR